LDAPLEDVLANYAEITASAYSVSLFSDPPTRGRMDQIWLKRRAEPAVDGTRWGATAADHDVHPIAGQDARAATPQQGEPGPWFERLPHFRASFTPSTGDEQQSEFFVARTDGPAAIEAVLALDLADAVQVNEFRTIAADDLWLSPFHDRESTALHFTWHDDDDLVRRSVEQVQKALVPFDPRPHWGKVFFLDRAELERHYPALDDFRRLAARHDPNRKFGNEFLETYVY
jgi:xylitol oxidase